MNHAMDSEVSAPALPSWLVCQIGAREHYAIPRALHRRGLLAELVTDFWVPPGNLIGRIPGGRRLRERFHADLADARIWAPNLTMLRFEALQRVRKRHEWDVIPERNALFQAKAAQRLRHWEKSWTGGSPPVLFSYSYGALALLRHAKAAGWRTVLGQIDPGPREERIVQEEHRRYPHLSTSWRPATAEYWHQWRQEADLADTILVNSPWSRDCLAGEGIDATKIQVVPLVHESGGTVPRAAAADNTLRVLFLGQINLRKGVGRLLDAMKMLEGHPISLTLVGSAEVDPSAWRASPNIRWVGPVPRSSTAGFYDQADLFVLPTLSDGYALTQLEALSRGVPVLASKFCGEAIKDGVGGWLLADLEPSTIRDRLLEIHDRMKDPTARPLPPPPAAAFDLDALGGALQRIQTGIPQ